MAETKTETSTADGILDRLLIHLFRYGFASLTMEEAAGIGGVSKRTLYKYFPNREALLGAALERRFGALGARIGAICDAPAAAGDWAGRFTAVMREVGAVVGSMQPVFMRDLAGGDPRLWERIRSFRRNVVLSRLAALMDEARRAGDVRADLDPKIVTTLLVAFIDDLANPNRLSEFPFTLQEVISTMANIFFQGILTDEGRRRVPQVVLFAGRPDASAAGEAPHA